MSSSIAITQGLILWAEPGDSYRPSSSSSEELLFFSEVGRPLTGSGSEIGLQPSTTFRFFFTFMFVLFCQNQLVVDFVFYWIYVKEKERASGWERAQICPPTLQAVTSGGTSEVCADMFCCMSNMCSLCLGQFTVWLWSGSPFPWGKIDLTDGKKKDGSHFMSLNS